MDCLKACTKHFDKVGGLISCCDLFINKGNYACNIGKGTSIVYTGKHSAIVYADTDASGA